MEVALFPSSRESGRKAGFVLCFYWYGVVFQWFFWCGVVLFFPDSEMANIDDLWARFSLTEEEEQGADVPRKKDVAIVRLAAKFFTKRVVNAEAVGRTFKPLWKLIGEM